MSELEINPFTSDHLHLDIDDFLRILFGELVTIDALVIHPPACLITGSRDDLTSRARNISKTPHWSAGGKV